MASGEDNGPGKEATVRASAPVSADDSYENSPPAYDALPPYTPAAPGSASEPTVLADSKVDKKKAPEEDTASSLSSLNLALTDEPLTRQIPNASTCLAHLKLLYAFRRLREEVGYCDGLWGIADPGKDSKAPEVPLETLSKLREKRWAIYLARAVDRYEAWWASLGGKGVTLAAMQVKGGEYEMFPFESNEVMHWREEMLMPLGECVGKAAV